ncbi:MAG: alpha/beta hydrolase [Anaerotruncus sp.]|nr:alpha/beta hydrolase [Anaerotruncus sp.]
MKTKEFSFKSATGVCRIHGCEFLPEGEVRAVVIIHHGMAEHINRYADYVKHLTDMGYAVFMHDMANHGKSNQKTELLGYFGENDGYKNLVKDLKTVYDIAKKEFPDKKIIMFGHSMGSFIVRCFDCAYPGASDASVYMGTGGSNPAAGMGKAISNLIASIKGSTYKSKMLDKITFGSFNKKTDKKTSFDWLTRDSAIVQKYIDDDYCGFLFTVKGMNDLVNLNVWANSAECYNTVKKDLPILLVAGADDPVGAYSKGINEVANKMKASGHTNVTVKLFPGCRHEVLNETNRQEVYEGIDAFLNANC